MRWWNRKISAGIDLSTVVRVVEEIPELRVTLVDRHGQGSAWGD